MKSKKFDLAEAFLAQARHLLEEHHLPRVTRSVKMLSDEEIWWRPQDTSNSVGNLVLHLAGNVRQWVISGLGGQPDRRERDQEFGERGPLPRRVLLSQLRKTVTEAGDVLGGLTTRQLAQAYSVQGFNVTGLEVIFHVTEHFAYHTGQIIYVTKLKRGKDLGFTHLPGAEAKKRAKKSLPAL